MGMLIFYGSAIIIGIAAGVLLSKITKRRTNVDQQTEKHIQELLQIKSEGRSIDNSIGTLIKLNIKPDFRVEY